MAKKKTHKKSSYPSSSREHQSIILLLAGGLVAILCLYLLGMDRFTPTKVYAPSTSNMQQKTTMMSPMPTRADEVTVTISSSGFYPDPVTVNVGAPLTFMNNDMTPHSATVYTRTIDTGTIPVGLSKTISFHTAGTYTYTDNFNKNWTGTIIVK